MVKQWQYSIAWFFLVSGSVSAASDTNATTLASYEQHVAEYIEKTAHEVTAQQREWINCFLSHVDPGATIFEIGSAFGRDADYMNARGYHVVRTDATQAFVDHHQSRGVACRVFNVLTDPLEQGLDGVFANAVFLHLTPRELAMVLDTIHDALREGGVLAFSVKRGYGQAWESEKLGAPRYFCYWQLHELCQRATMHGFEVVYKHDSDPDIWLSLVMQRR